MNRKGKKIIADVKSGFPCHWCHSFLGMRLSVDWTKVAGGGNAAGTFIPPHCEHHPLIVFPFSRPLPQVKIYVA